MADLRRLIMLCILMLLVQSARCDFVQLIDTQYSTSGGRVSLIVTDPDDKLSHTWKSDSYDSISELASNGGVVSFVGENSGGLYLNAAVYDPGDRKWHAWKGSRASSCSSVTNSGGVVACIDDNRAGVVAVAYDPADRAWHRWLSSTFATVEEFSLSGGVVAVSANAGKNAAGAAYDPVDHEWHVWQLTSSAGDIADFTNKHGVVAMLSAGKTVAKAYDPGDRKWHSWNDTTATDENLVNSGGVVAFSRETKIYAAAYDADERKWRTWNYDAKGELSNIGINNGVVTYTANNRTYTHSMVYEPKAIFRSVPTTIKDSMYVQFIDASFGVLDSWSWNFGDGTTSSRRSPTHIYTKPGNYTVTLRVTGPIGADSTVRTITVTTPTYTLSYAAGANGSIKGTTPQSVKYGSTATTITAVPAATYHFAKWSDNSTANPRRDTNVKANMSVTASFALNQFLVNFRTDGTPGAMLSGLCGQIVNYGCNCSSIRALEPSGYKFRKWTNGLADYSTSNPLTVAKVTSNMTLTARFVRHNASRHWHQYE